MGNVHDVKLGCYIKNKYMITKLSVAFVESECQYIVVCIWSHVSLMSVMGDRVGDLPN